MSPKDFTNQHPGRLVAIQDGLTAFVPDPIPSSLELSSTVQRAHERAILGLGELRAIIPSLPNPQLLTSPFLRREAVKSSRIEGTKTEVDQLLLFEAAGGKTVRNDEESLDAREVLNYVVAIEAAIRYLADDPKSGTEPRRINQWLIRGMHRELMTGVRGADKQPGEYRDCQAFISAGQLEDARFVPPPATEVQAAMASLDQFLASESAYPSLVAIALAHYQFETIHPFRDGNGRVGRLLIMLLLIHTGLLSEPLLYLSAYFERHRSDYNDALWQVSRSGAWEHWVLFFLRGVISESRDAFERARALLGIREKWRAKVQEAGQSTAPLQLIDRLFEYPVIDIPKASELLGMTYRGAQMAVERLESLGFLTETTGQKRNRVYLATPVTLALKADEIPSFD